MYSGVVVRITWTRSYGLVSSDKWMSVIMSRRKRGRVGPLLLIRSILAEAVSVGLESMETFTEAKEFVDNPNFREQRQESLGKLD